MKGTRVKFERVEIKIEMPTCDKCEKVAPFINYAKTQVELYRHPSGDRWCAACVTAHRLEMGYYLAEEWMAKSIEIHKDIYYFYSDVAQALGWDNSRDNHEVAEVLKRAKVVTSSGSLDCESGGFCIVFTLKQKKAAVAFTKRLNKYISEHRV